MRDTGQDKAAPLFWAPGGAKCDVGVVGGGGRLSLEHPRMALVDRRLAARRHNPALGARRPKARRRQGLHNENFMIFAPLKNLPQRAPKR